MFQRGLKRHHSYSDGVKYFITPRQAMGWVFNVSNTCFELCGYRQHIICLHYYLKYFVLYSSNYLICRSKGLFMCLIQGSPVNLNIATSSISTPTLIMFNCKIKTKQTIMNQKKICVTPITTSSKNKQQSNNNKQQQTHMYLHCKKNQQQYMHLVISQSIKLHMSSCKSS